MKRKLSVLGAVAVLGLTGCASYSEDKTIVVGASSVPHAEILEFAETQLSDLGYELDVQVFDDYVLPNKALANGDLDANYFQHQPYLDEQVKEYGYEIESVANVHVEPIKLYSQNYSSVDDIENGATILLSNSVSDQARVLNVLAENDLITIKDGVDPEFITFDDIESNPLDLQFDADYDPALLTKVYDNNEGDIVAINTNYALAAGLDSSSALLSESDDSPYANVIAVQSSEVDSPKTEALVTALTSDETADFISTQYDGAVIPASN